MEKNMERVSKENYYLDIAQTVATRSTCLRKSFGAIIVKTTLSFPPVITERREEEKTVAISVPV